MDDLQQLGGSIDLVGFRDLDGASMIVVKKLVGNYARKFSDRMSAFERLVITVKQIHSSEESQGQFELHAKLLHSGKSTHSENTNHNLFFGVDTVLKNIEKQVL